MQLVYVVGHDQHHMRVRAAELISKGVGCILQWHLGSHDNMFLLLMATAPTYWRVKINDMELELLKRCDAVYLCADWKESDKAKVAMNLARQHNKQILIEGFAEPK